MKTLIILEFYKLTIINALLEKVIKQREGYYCHCVEVSDVYDLENIAEAIIQENETEFDKETIINFLETLEVYCLDYANEKEIFAFDFREYITTSLD